MTNQEWLRAVVDALAKGKKGPFADAYGLVRTSVTDWYNGKGSPMSWQSVLDVAEKVGRDLPARLRPFVEQGEQVQEPPTKQAPSHDERINSLERRVSDMEAKMDFVTSLLAKGR